MGTTFFTEEHRRKISEAGKGRKWTEAQRAKMVAAMTGRKPTVETRQKMSESAKKKRLSELHKRAIGLANANRLPISEETRAKMKAAQTPEIRARAAAVRAAANKARVWTNEMRAKASAAACNRSLVFPHSGTKLEQLVESRLHGRAYEKQAKIDGANHRWDFVLRAERTLVEADGCYYHGCAKCGRPGKMSSILNDEKKSKLAKELGWKLIRVPQCEAAAFTLR